MNIKKEPFAVSLFTISFVLLFFMPSIVGLMPSQDIKDVISITIYALVFLFLIYLTYDDIKRRKFTTTVYIVLIDIVGIITFIFIFYTFFTYSKETNIQTILHVNNVRIIGLSILLCSSVSLNYLKSDKFVKSN